MMPSTSAGTAPGAFGSAGPARREAARLARRRLRLEPTTRRRPGGRRRATGRLGRREAVRPGTGGPEARARQDDGRREVHQATAVHRGAGRRGHQGEAHPAAVHRVTAAEVREAHPEEARRAGATGRLRSTRGRTAGRLRRPGGGTREARRAAGPPGDCGPPGGGPGGPPGRGSPGDCGPWPGDCGLLASPRVGAVGWLMCSWRGSLCELKGPGEGQDHGSEGQYRPRPLQRPAPPGRAHDRPADHGGQRSYERPDRREAHAVVEVALARGRTGCGSARRTGTAARCTARKGQSARSSPGRTSVAAPRATAPSVPRTQEADRQLRSTDPLDGGTLTPLCAGRAPGYPYVGPTVPRPR